MDTQLFMECEEEELEPWQQVDDGVDEDDDDDDELASSEATSATRPRAGHPRSKVPPLNPTQTSGGARLFFTDQAFPAAAPGPSPSVDPPRKLAPAQRHAAGVSLPKGGALPGVPAVLNRHAGRGRPGPDTAAVYSGAGPTKVVLSVDEFYYGTSGEEHPLRRKYHPALKSDAFSCDICQRAISDNLRLVQHTLQHSPLVRGGDEHKMCSFCFRHFSGGAQLQGHREQVHGSSPSSCTCRICEWAFDNESAFLNHMKTNHKPGEMPYICQVCFYRSSFYSDVLQHFARFHKNSRYLLCVFCLKVSRNVAGYQRHVLSHKAGGGFHCNRCRLQFAHPADKKRHKLERHRSVRRPAKLEGLPLGSKVTIRMYGKRRLAAPAAAGDARLLRDPSCLVQPIKFKARRRDASPPVGGPPPAKASRSTWLNPGSLSCWECGGDVSDFAAHYPTHVRCLLCAFGSCCSRAYAAHMIRHHVPRPEEAEFRRPRRGPPPCPFYLVCSRCDFASVSGDKMAVHLALNPEHAAAACRSREYIEPDIQLSSDEEEKAKDEDPPTDGWEPAGVEAGGEGRAAPFAQPRGPRPPLLRDGDAADFFDLLFPPALVELIAAETNAHGESRRRQGAAFGDWRPVTPREIRAFLGQCVLTGAESPPEREDGRRAVSPRRFRQLASAVRMGSLGGDVRRRGEDPLRPFRRMLDILSGAMWEAYRPNCCLSVDRALLPAPEGDAAAGGRPPEVWLLCDSKSGYCHRFFIRTGPKRGRETGFRVARELLKGLEHKRHQIYLAGSLTSVPLLQKLLEQGIYASGSFPPPSRVLPPALWEEGRLEKAGDFLQRRRGPLLATRWRDAKEMGCLSTNAPAGEADTVWRRSQSGAGGLDPVRRPMAFRLLQENMRGVDICKQLLACNPLGGILQDRHWRSLFWFLVNLSVVNAFIVLRESRKDNPPSWVRDGLFAQANFRRRLGVQLCEGAERGAVPERDVVSVPAKAPVPGRPRRKVPRRHRLCKIGGTSKKCQHCGGDREGSWGCGLCRVRLCKKPQCFWEFHGLSPLREGPTEVGSADVVVPSGVVKREKAQDHLAPLEDPDFSENEAEERAAVKEEAPSPPPSAPPPDDAPEERADFLSAHQLRVALLALCGGAGQASAIFGTEPRLVRSWLKEARRHLRRKGRECPAPDGEARLAAWVLSQRERQLPVSESVLFHKAAALNKDGALDGFRVSYQWAVLFMLRHRLGPGRAPAPALPPYLSADVRSFKDFARKIVRVHRLPRNAVAAADELCLFVDPLSFRDPERRARALSFAGSTPLVTVCLSALADGSALPALVLSHGGPDVEAPAADCAVLAAASPDPSPGEAFKLWTQRVWLPYVSGTLGRGKSMLVLDRHHEHAGELSLGALSASGTLPAVVPEGCSFLLQPLDLAAKPALERFLMARWNKFCAEGDEERDDDDDAARVLIRWTVRALARIKGLRRLWRTSFEMTGILPGDEESPDREGERRGLREELENTLLTSEDGSRLPEAEDEDDEDDSEDGRTSAEKGKEDKGETGADAHGERFDHKERDTKEAGEPETDGEITAKDDRRKDREAADRKEEPAAETKRRGYKEQETQEAEEDGEEEEESDGEDRRETRIAIGEEVGREWQIATETEPVEPPQTD
ncbi:pogo transposable element with ZNF domain [Corythoichthys intestinalis]|uniref:pogo transposable element with ZNF domain n=1 Tax=Corythoichthys intestinalis TaxID=161448 RepID=UPI0025A5674C|nr:pogo transposable element with ZNF domain [Corythoichthys intestinalis]